MPIHLLMASAIYCNRKAEKLKTCLSNHTRAISHHVMLLLINALRGGHIHIHTQTHTDAITKAISRNQACARLARFKISATCYCTVQTCKQVNALPSKGNTY